MCYILILDLVGGDIWLGLFNNNSQTCTDGINGCSCALRDSYDNCFPGLDTLTGLDITADKVNKTGAPSDPLADFWAKMILKIMVK